MAILGHPLWDKAVWFHDDLVNHWSLLAIFPCCSSSWCRKWQKMAFPGAGTGDRACLVGFETKLWSCCGNLRVSHFGTSERMKSAYLLNRFTRSWPRSWIVLQAKRLLDWSSLDSASLRNQAERCFTDLGPIWLVALVGFSSFIGPTKCGLPGDARSADSMQFLSFSSQNAHTQPHDWILHFACSCRRENDLILARCNHVLLTKCICLSKPRFLSFYQ